MKSLLLMKFVQKEGNNLFPYAILYLMNTDKHVLSEKDY